MLIFFSASCIFFASCSTDAKDELRNEKSSGVLSEEFYSLSEVGLPLKMKLPGELLEINTPEIVYNSSFGQSEIRIGDRLDISVSQDDLTMGQIKSDLNADQLFSYKFLDCGEDQLFYQAVLPTGEAYYFHFAASIMLEGERYLIRTNPISEFTKKDIELLIEAVNSIEFEEYKSEEDEEL